MFFYVFIALVAGVIGFLAGILFGKHNPDFVEEVDEAYDRGREEALDEFHELMAELREAVAKLKGKK